MRITLEELEQRIKKHGPKMAIENVQVEGVAVIKDKDGNVKRTLKITNIELEDEQCNS